MPNTTSLAQCSTWPPTPNAHTYRLLIFKERAASTIRPSGLYADRKTVSFVASPCQQRRSGIMEMPRMDVNSFLHTEGPHGPKTDRSSCSHRPKIGPKSQSSAQGPCIVIICNLPAFDALISFEGVTGGCQRASEEMRGQSVRRTGAFGCAVASFHTNKITTEKPPFIALMAPGRTDLVTVPVSGPWHSDWGQGLCPRLRRWDCAHLGRAQRCLKLAGRFSRKARMPSFWSSVAKRP